MLSGSPAGARRSPGGSLLGAEAAAAHCREGPARSRVTSQAPPGLHGCGGQRAGRVSPGELPVRGTRPVGSVHGSGLRGPGRDRWCRETPLTADLFARSFVTSLLELSVVSSF